MKPVYWRKDINKNADLNSVLARYNPSLFLDLGCGIGKEMINGSWKEGSTLIAARSANFVLAVDNVKSHLKQLSNDLEKLNISNVRTMLADFRFDLGIDLSQYFINLDGFTLTDYVGKRNNEDPSMFWRILTEGKIVLLTLHMPLRNKRRKYQRVFGIEWTDYKDFLRKVIPVIEKKTGKQIEIRLSNHKYARLLITEVISMDKETVKDALGHEIEMEYGVTIPRARSTPVEIYKVIIKKFIDSGEMLVKLNSVGEEPGKRESLVQSMKTAVKELKVDEIVRVHGRGKIGLEGLHFTYLERIDLI